MVDKSFLPMDQWCLLEDLASEEHWFQIMEMQRVLRLRENLSIDEILKAKSGNWRLKR
jgi:hypothetical protein